MRWWVIPELGDVVVWQQQNSVSDTTHRAVERLRVAKEHQPSAHSAYTEALGLSDIVLCTLDIALVALLCSPENSQLCPVGMARKAGFAFATKRRILRVPVGFPIRLRMSITHCAI